MANKTPLPWLSLVVLAVVMAWAAQQNDCVLGLDVVGTPSTAKIVLALICQVVGLLWTYGALSGRLNKLYDGLPQWLYYLGPLPLVLLFSSHYYLVDGLAVGFSTAWGTQSSSSAVLAQCRDQLFHSVLHLPTGAGD